jgi:flagellar basal-body rod modification protein FlgD
MQVTSSTSADRILATTAPDSSGTPVTTTGPKVLGQDDFLKLLAVQFQQQDPMKPMDDTAFIAQMAQFTSLDQSSSMLKQMTQLSATQGLSTANSYLGRQVTIDNGDGTTAVGVVSAVQVSGGAPQLVMNGAPYPVSSVIRVEPAPATSSTNSNPTNP